MKQSNGRTSIHTKHKNPKENGGKPGITKIIATVLFALGAIPFAYMTFYDRNLSVWIAYGGSLLIMAGIFLFVYGHIKSIFLYLVFPIVAIIGFVISNSLQKADAIRQTQAQHIKDSIIIALSDSIKNIQPLIERAKSLESNANKKYELTNKYFESKNEPSIRFTGMTSTIEIGKNISVFYQFENTGGISPEVIIYNSILWHTVPFSKFTLFKKSKKVIKDFAQNETNNLICPRQELTKEFYNNMLTGKIYVYCYGRFEYTNIHGKKYKKDFCDVWDKDAKTFINVSNYEFIYE